MKKKFINPLLFALPIFFSATEAYAQKGFNAGIDFGYNASFMFDNTKYAEVPYNIKFKAGPAYDIDLGFNWNDYYGVEIEGIYANMGANYEVMSTNKDYQKEFDLAYFQVPIMFKISGGDYPDRYTTMFGPTFGFLNSASMNSDSSANGEVKSSFKAPDFGVLLVTGGDLTIKNHLYLNIALRIYYGLSTVNNNPAIITNSPSSNEKLSNAYIGLSIGLHNLFVKTKPDKPANW